MVSHTESMDLVADENLVVDDLDSMDLVVNGKDLDHLPWKELPYQSLCDLLVEDIWGLRFRVINPPVLTSLRVMQGSNTLPPDDLQCTQHTFLPGRRQLVLFNHNQHIAQPVLPEASQALVKAVHNSMDKHITNLWQTKQEKLRTLLHNIHTQPHGSVLFEHHVQKLSQEISTAGFFSADEVRNFCWVFCCKQMMDVERFFHAERLDKWCWIVKFIVDKTTALENKLSLRILEFFVKARIDCQSDQKTAKQIERKIAKIDKCLMWVHTNFPTVATGYQDCCAQMLSYACNDQPCFQKQANVLAYFLQHNEKCHQDVVGIFARAWGSGAGFKNAAEICSSWLLQNFPCIYALMHKLA